MCLQRPGTVLPRAAKLGSSDTCVFGKLEVQLSQRIVMKYLWRQWEIKDVANTERTQIEVNCLTSGVRWWIQQMVWRGFLGSCSHSCFKSLGISLLRNFCFLSTRGAHRPAHCWLQRLSSAGDVAAGDIIASGPFSSSCSKVPQRAGDWEKGTEVRFPITTPIVP